MDHDNLIPFPRSARDRVEHPHEPWDTALGSPRRNDEAALAVVWFSLALDAFANSDPEAEAYFGAAIETIAVDLPGYLAHDAVKHPRLNPATAALDEAVRIAVWLGILTSLARQGINPVNRLLLDVCGLGALVGCSTAWRTWNERHLARLDRRASWSWPATE